MSRTLINKNPQQKAILVAGGSKVIFEEFYAKFNPTLFIRTKTDIETMLISNESWHRDVQKARSWKCWSQPDETSVIFIQKLWFNVELSPYYFPIEFIKATYVRGIFPRLNNEQIVI